MFRRIGMHLIFCSICIIITHTCSSSKIELQLYSPSLKVYSENGRGPMAVFSHHDQVGGKVTLDPSCGHTGRLAISVRLLFSSAKVCMTYSGQVEGSFLYRPPANLDEGQSTPTPLADVQTITFMESTTTIVLSNSDSSQPRSMFRDAFIKRRPSISGISNSVTASSSERTHPFTFSLPQSPRSGEEIPATFASSGGPSDSDYFEVVYKVVADWEPNDTSEMPSRYVFGHTFVFIAVLTFSLVSLEVPFILQPDAEFQCADASGTTPESWLEMPLIADRPIPVRCAVSIHTEAFFYAKLTYGIDYPPYRRDLLTIVIHSLLCCFHNNAAVCGNGKGNCSRRINTCLISPRNQCHRAPDLPSPLPTVDAIQRGLGFSLVAVCRTTP